MVGDEGIDRMIVLMFVEMIDLEQRNLLIWVEEQSMPDRWEYNHFHPILLQNSVAMIRRRHYNTQIEIRSVMVVRKKR